MNVNFGLALQTLHKMVQDFVGWLPLLVLAAISYAFFHIAAVTVRKLLVRVTERRKKHRSVALVVGRLAQAGLILLGILVAMVIAVPSFRPAQLVQLLGIGSVAVGFAFRDILQNFLAGVLLLLTEPFRIGDQIIVQSFEGTVENIETRATFIRTYDGRRVVIPNATLFTESVMVNTASEIRRLQYDVGIGYGDDVDRARSLIVEALNGLETVLKNPPPEALLVELAPSSVNIRARWWIRPPRKQDVWESYDEVLPAIKHTLSGAGIDLPYPTQQLLFHDQTEETDGDRRRQREGWPASKGEAPRPRSIAAALFRSRRRPNGTGAEEHRGDRQPKDGGLQDG